MNRQKFSFTSIGTVSLFMIFAVLCMAILASLSLSSASVDLRSARRLADHQTEYYKASGNAEQTLSTLREEMERIYEASADTDTYYETVRTSLAEESMVEDLIVSENETDQLLVSFTCPLNETQVLSARLALLDPASGAGFFKILSWQEVTTADWEVNNTLNLIP